MEKVAPNSKFVVHSNEIIWQSKIKGPFKHLDFLPNFHTYLKKKVYVYFLSIVKVERLLRKYGYLNSRVRILACQTHMETENHG